MAHDPRPICLSQFLKPTGHPSAMPPNPIAHVGWTISNFVADIQIEEASLVDLSFGGRRVLHHVLAALSPVPALWQCQCFPPNAQVMAEKGWNAVCLLLVNCIAKADSPNSQHDGARPRSWIITWISENRCGERCGDCINRRDNTLRQLPSRRVDRMDGHGVNAEVHQQLDQAGILQVRVAPLVAGFPQHIQNALPIFMAYALAAS
ncbi:MAG: hypothetical protein JWQ65_1777 [Devosia sp.]|nr:hypothetical protein [Devosia sp.]